MSSVRQSVASDLRRPFDDRVGGDVKEARILIIDGSVAVRRAIDAYLRTNGFLNLTHASDGAEGLQVVETWRPDLIITDLTMPNVDGFELCRRVRSGAESSDIPILVQTGMNKAAHRAEAFSAGATDLITRPISSGELLGRVRVHLEHRRLIERLSEFQRHMSQELDQARAMQESLLPADDAMRRLEARFPIALASYYEASIGLGGDIWDIQEVDDNRLMVFSADFSGHGVGAALNTFRLHSFILGGSVPTDDAASWLAGLNRFLCDVLPVGQFATMFCGIIDFSASTLQYASAAAPWQMVRDGEANRGFEIIADPGFPLGLSREATYENHVRRFGPDSVLFLFSDALIETPDMLNPVFSIERLRAFLDERWDKASPAAIQLAMLDELNRLAPDKPSDDLTMITLHRVREQP
ncbi:MAG TPA: SpoIIE family protein phosphatase [Xanthobacteraceae bacterium]|nr:SpoIIE family protein phosphatase [Xanthobacteraceae bacterium]